MIDTENNSELVSQFQNVSIEESDTGINDVYAKGSDGKDHQIGRIGHDRKGDFVKSYEWHTSNPIVTSSYGVSWIKDVSDENREDGAQTLMKCWENPESEVFGNQYKTIPLIAAVDEIQEALGSLGFEPIKVKNDGALKTMRSLLPDSDKDDHYTPGT